MGVGAMGGRLRHGAFVGVMTATALMPEIGDGRAFKRGREVSAYLGLAPGQVSSGERHVLRGIG